jgi:hypothetical protein
MRKWMVCLGIVMAAAVRAASADESVPFARGAAGLNAVPFVARNAASARIACSVALAHWYSVDLGEAGPGESVRAELWADSKTGAIFVLNRIEDHMPAQLLWCGIAGRAWATRAAIPLAHRAGERPPPIDLTCMIERDRLVCR